MIIISFRAGTVPLFSFISPPAERPAHHPKSGPFFRAVDRLKNLKNVHPGTDNPGMPPIRGIGGCYEGQKVALYDCSCKRNSGKRVTDRPTGRIGARLITIEGETAGVMYHGLGSMHGVIAWTVSGHRQRCNKTPKRTGPVRIRRRPAVPDFVFPAQISDTRNSPGSDSKRWVFDRKSGWN